VKIEIGESLLRSWLRHVKGCQLAELNWKPSSSWEKHEDLQSLMEQARAFFLNSLNIDIFKKITVASQLIKQAEIDVLGVKLGMDGRIQAIYGIDVAYHEAGLNYGDNIIRILKKWCEEGWPFIPILVRLPAIWCSRRHSSERHLWRRLKVLCRNCANSFLGANLIQQHCFTRTIVFVTKF
jgi:hypothetical protein